MTVYMVISLPKIPYAHRIYMVLANPTKGPAELCREGKNMYSGLCTYAVMLDFGP